MIQTLIQDPDKKVTICINLTEEERNLFDTILRDLRYQRQNKPTIYKLLNNVITNLYKQD